MAKKALVLGGGGPVGIAWESGLLSGFAEAGVDLSDADFILGTSAGSFVGAQLAMGARPASRAAPFLAMARCARQAPGAETGSYARCARPPAAPDLTLFMRKMAEAQSGVRPAEQVRAEIGAWAIEQAPMSEDAFIQSFGRFLAELPADAWPQKGYACTAVDAETGAFRLWDKAAGVGLARAVASSCGVPGVYPPVRSPSADAAISTAACARPSTPIWRRAMIWSLVVAIRVAAWRGRGGRARCARRSTPRTPGAARWRGQGRTDHPRRRTASPPSVPT